MGAPMVEPGMWLDCIESWSSDVRPSSTRSIAWRRIAVDVSSKRARDVASSWGVFWSKDAASAEAEDVEDMTVVGKASVPPPGQHRRQVDAWAPRGPARGNVQPVQSKGVEHLRRRAGNAKGGYGMDYCGARWDIQCIEDDSYMHL